MNIKTNITFEKFDSRHNLLQRHSQPCKSFVKQLWELMYVASAQLDRLTPRDNVLDVAGQLESLSQTALDKTTKTDAYMRGNLMVEAPGGRAGVYVPNGDFFSGSTFSGQISRNNIDAMLRGELLGICIGTDNTAVAPNDFRLASRIFHGQDTAIAVSQIMQSLTTGDSFDSEIYDVRSYGNLFTVKKGFRLSSVKILIYREGNPGTVTLNIAAAGRGSSQPWPSPAAWTIAPIATATTNGDTLTNVSPGEWREFTFATPFDLVPNTIYALYPTVVGGSAVQNIHWRGTNPSIASNPYGINTTNSGTSWSNQNTTFLYELWGTSNTEVEYGGCGIHGMNAANPNASFNISRCFYNHSGESVDIKECGIGAAGIYQSGPGNADAHWRGNSLAFLIARDVVAPTITLNDGQVLQVTYTPAVTV